MHEFIVVRSKELYVSLDSIIILKILKIFPIYNIILSKRTRDYPVLLLHFMGMARQRYLRY